MPVTAPADRRFLRAAQVKPGRRRAPWRTWIRVARVVVLLAIVLTATVWSARQLARAPWLRVSRITVTGTQHLSSGEVAALVEGVRGQNLLFVRLDDWRQKVLTNRWVADATLRRALPAAIEVRVVERHPIAIGRVADAFFLLDEGGAVIDEYGPRYADFDLPILDGLAPTSAKEAAANERRVELASRVLRDVQSRPDLAKRISQLDVSDPRNAVVLVDQDTARVRLGNERFLERLQSYVDLAQTLHDQVPAIDYVDLRFGERVYVGSQARAMTMAAAQAAPQAGPRRPGT